MGKANEMQKSKASSNFIEKKSKRMTETQESSSEDPQTQTILDYE